MKSQARRWNCLIALLILFRPALADPVRATMGFGPGVLRGTDSRGRAFAVVVETSISLLRQMDLNFELSSIQGARYLPDPDYRQDTMVGQFGLAWWPFQSPKRTGFDASHLRFSAGIGLGFLFRSRYDKWAAEVAGL